MKPLVQCTKSQAYLEGTLQAVSIIKPLADDGCQAPVKVLNDLLEPVVLIDEFLEKAKNVCENVNSMI